ncbi:MAG: polysaccharide biosynthesis tyrosine autokinase, partial [Chloroflexota bacterium]
LALGFIVSSAAGLGLMFLFEMFDNRPHSIEDVEALFDYQVLAHIPKVNETGPFLLNGNSPQGEAYRRLRTNLLIPRDGQVLRSLIITSAEPGEGKSTTAANLALSIAHSGREVIVVDCDMRASAMHLFFDRPNDVGLSSVLIGEVPLDDAIQETDKPGLYLLSSGPASSNTSELLGLPEMEELLDRLTEKYDFVLLDTPPLLAVSDAAILLSRVDRTLLVVDRDQSSPRAIEAATEQLSLVQAKMVGAIINRTDLNKRYPRYYNQFR